MKRSLVLVPALALLGFAAPSLADTPPAPSVDKASDRGFDGRVEELLTTKGDVDGILLDTGITVHFPKSQADEVSDLATIGSNVRVQGVGHPGPNKHTVVEAQKIMNLDNGASLTLTPQVAPPPPR